MELNRITFLEGGIVYGLPSIVPFVLEPDRIKLMDLLQARFKTFGGPIGKTTFWRPADP